MATSYATVSWDQLHRDARLLATKLIPLGPFRGIVAVTRGGMIPAAIVARELECRVVETIGIVAYGAGTDPEQSRRPPELVKPATEAGDGDGFLVIDDLVDSGLTAGLVRQLLPRAYFACLYAKPDGRGTTDSFVVEVSQDTWILFPWDTAPLFVPPLARQPTPDRSDP